MDQHEKRGWSINQHLFCNSLVKTVKNNNWQSGQNNWETFLVQNVSRDLYQHKLFTGNKGKLRLCYFSEPSFLIPVFLFSISYTLLYFSLNKRFPDRIWNIIFVKKKELHALPLDHLTNPFIKDRLFSTTWFKPYWTVVTFKFSCPHYRKHFIVGLLNSPLLTRWKL